MCLDYVDVALTEKYKKRKRFISSFKAVTVDENDLHHPLIHDKEYVFSIGENLANTKKMIVSFFFLLLSDKKRYPIKEYQSGFHSYLNKKEVGHLSFKIIKVYINPKDIICVGYQSNILVVVSSKIHIKSLSSI